MILRVARENSARLYQLLEAYEGLANYSTVTTEKGLGYRDIKLFPAPDLKGELVEVLALIKRDIPFQVL